MSRSMSRISASISSRAGAVLGVMRKSCAAQVVDDGLVFDGVTLLAEPIREEAEYNGLRIDFS